MTTNWRIILGGQIAIVIALGGTAVVFVLALAVA